MLGIVRTVGLRFLLANRVPVAALDAVLRVATASVLSPAARYRFLLAGIHPRTVSAVLRRIRRLQDWPRSWVRAAHGYLVVAQQRAAAGEWRAAAEFRRAAALCYHFAHVLVWDDLARRRELYRTAARLFHATISYLDPAVRRVEIPWRNIELPGYLRIPERTPAPLVVFLNGASTAKEEMLGWSDAFVRRGLAVLALDTPGSGEIAETMPARPGQEDIGYAILQAAERFPGIDPTRVALLGVSLRGAYAVHLAHAVPEIGAVVSVTPPFDPEAYLPALGEFVRRDVAFAVGTETEHLEALAPALSLVNIAPRLRTPLLVVGAGNDLVVPPQESLRLFRAAGGIKHLLYFARANHVAFTHLEQWTGLAAAWLAVTLGV